MSIHFISGKPGASKTAFVVGDKIVDELRKTDRPIITNIALRLHPWVDAGGVARRGLLRTLQDKYGETFEAESRIIFLTPEECRHFWRVRATRAGPWDSWEKIVLPLPEDGKFHFDGKVCGCCYCIDEVHEYLPGQTVEREDAAKNTELLSWASQQRRAGDTAYLISQVVVNVNKKVRAVSQDCYWLTNHRKLAMGWFRQPDIWTYRLYATTPPAAGEEQLKKDKISFNREDVFGMYDTVAGASVAGGKGDLGERAKGLPLWSIGVGIVLACLLVAVVVKGAIVGVGSGVKLMLANSTPASPVSTNRPAPVSAVPQPAQLPPMLIVDRSQEKRASLPLPAPAKPIVVEGVATNRINGAYRNENGWLVVVDNRGPYSADDCEMKISGGRVVSVTLPGGIVARW